MTQDEARNLLQTCVKLYNKEVVNESDVIYRLHFVAAVIEPEEIMAAVPEGVRRRLLEDAARPLPKFEDDLWLICGVSSQRGEPTEEQIKASIEADKERYRGHCRLHEYLNRPNR